MVLSKNCLVCHNLFYKKSYDSKKSWENDCKYCSRQCQFLSMKGKKAPNKGRKGRTPWNKGIKTPQVSGKNHGQWKGDNVGYFSLHIWVNNILGKATKCENSKCKKISVFFVWANISGEYKRDISDWHQLCNSCNHLDGIKIHTRFAEVL